MTLYTRLVKVTVPRAQGYTLQASSAHVKNSCVHLYGKYYFHFLFEKHLGAMNLHPRFN